jgi:hypothetical protein
MNFHDRAPHAASPSRNPPAACGTGRAKQAIENGDD